MTYSGLLVMVALVALCCLLAFTAVAVKEKGSRASTLALLSYAWLVACGLVIYAARTKELGRPLSTPKPEQVEMTDTGMTSTDAMSTDTTMTMSTETTVSPADTQ